MKDGTVVASVKGRDLCLKTKNGRPVATLFMHRSEVHKVGVGLVPKTALPIGPEERVLAPKEEARLYEAKLSIFADKGVVKRVVRGKYFGYIFRGNGFRVRNDEGFEVTGEEPFFLLEKLDAIARKKAGIEPRPEFTLKKLAFLWEEDPEATCEMVVDGFRGKWRLINGEFVSRKRGTTVVIVPSRATLSVEQHKNGFSDLVTLVESVPSPFAKGTAGSWMRTHARELASVA
ncbi:MAG: hypothetical protein PHO15_11680 [Eubacteriales bacterium]|nr:hypothetical protein [Eubacteriales bacterium]